jgi:Fur family transcriptional regulator, ferric uptake regulator
MSKCEHSHKKPRSAEDLKKLIKSKGMSFTHPRRAILEILVREHGPFSADEIHKRLPDKLCDLATVFRTLKQFREHNLVTPVKFDEDFTRYEFNDPHHHHHHVVCTQCQKMTTLDDCFLESFEKKLLKLGFRNISHTLEFFAVCPRCAQSA